ncbi:TPA: hypothetical protein DCX16_03075 [bacterium]|nr:hypothetical protein [bacterium]
MVEVHVAGVALDQISNMPIIILKDNDERELPIWVGMFEAQAILMVLENITPPRPMTHDLLKNVVYTLGANLKRVVITGLNNNTYFAKLIIFIDGAIREIDSRPSDAIALALRTNSPIYVDPSVMSSSIPITPIDDEEVRRFKEQLKNIELEDFL